MTGRMAVAVILAAAVICGGLMYYLQVWGYYRSLPGDTAILLARSDGTLRPLDAAGFAGIDARSSPIRFRACLTGVTLPADGIPYPAPEPLIAPGWFDCFDATAIGTALRDGTARAVLGQRDIHPGVDRVVAIFPDGRAFVWHQLAAATLRGEGAVAPVDKEPDR